VRDRTDAFLQTLGTTSVELLGLEQLDSRPGEVTVFISGSLLEGLGNKTSDIDLYVIGPVQPNGELVISKKDFICIAKHRLAGRRVDVEFWQPQAVAELADRLSSVVIGRNLDAFECEEIDFLHRMKIGLPLLGAPLLEEWRRRFDFTKLVRYMKHQASVNLRDVVEDLEGMLDNGDIEVAVIRCHDLLGDLCEYGLRCVGETNPKRKWGIKLLSKYPDSELARGLKERYWQLQVPDGSRIRNDAEAAREYIRACMTLAQDLLESTSDQPAAAGVAPSA